MSGGHADPVAALLDVLRAERAALESDDAARLPELAARKEHLLRTCAAVVAGADKARRGELRPSLAEARRLNDLNALLLLPRLNSVRARLAVLTGNADYQIYGANGLSRSPFGGGRRGFAA